MSCKSGSGIGICVAQVGPQGPPGAQGPPGSLIGNVVNLAASQTITAGQNGTLFTNTNSSGSINADLPASPAPFSTLVYSFYVGIAQTLNIVAPAGVTIKNGADSSSSGGQIFSNTVGNLLTIVLINSTTWLVTTITGIWELE